jgi:hypothetical protein
MMMKNTPVAVLYRSELFDIIQACLEIHKGGLNKDLWKIYSAGYRQELEFINAYLITAWMRKAMLSNAIWGWR